MGNAFENRTDARRTLREILLLRHRRHENVIAVRDIMRASRDKFNDVYLVYELMDTDLHQIIRSPQPLSDEHARYFTYQACVVVVVAVVVVVVVKVDRAVNYCADVDAC